VCTQDEKLREKFTGTPDKIVNLFTFIAEEVREILSKLGFKSLNDVIGRTDLLRQVSKGSSNLDDLDLSPLFIQADPGEIERQFYSTGVIWFCWSIVWCFFHKRIEIKIIW
jgi:glutamate synthase (NADPH/NADH) large chain